AIIFMPAHLDAPQAAFATEIAQTRIVMLPDGSRVTLGAHSEIEQRFSANERRVVLTGGEAFFEVTHNPPRPFFVEAGQANVRVTGTKFNVSQRQSGVAVAVLEGEVHVASDRAVTGSDMRILHAGQSVEVRREPIIVFDRAVVQQVAAVGPAEPGG